MWTDGNMDEPCATNTLWEPCGVVHWEPFGHVCIMVNMSVSPQHCISYLGHFENEDQNALWVMGQFTWRGEHSRTHNERNGSDYAHLPPFLFLFFSKSPWQGVLVPQRARNTCDDHNTVFYVTQDLRHMTSFSFLSSFSNLQSSGLAESVSNNRVFGHRVAFLLPQDTVMFITQHNT